MKENKYVGVYFGIPLIRNPQTLVTYSLLFDELHLIFQTWHVQATPALLEGRDLSVEHSAKLKVPSYRTGRYPEIYKAEEERYVSFMNALEAWEIELLTSAKPLVNTVIHCHFDVHFEAFMRVQQSIKDGTASKQPTWDMVNDITNRVVTPITKEYPLLEKLGATMFEAITAIKMARDNDWCLLTDAMDSAFLSTGVRPSVTQLSSTLSEECIKLALPKCNAVTPDEILEAREKLQDLLIPFRMSMQKLSTQLRMNIKDAKNMADVRAEAKFIAESQVEPALYELKRKIEREKERLLIRLFGTVVSWVPLLAKVFLMPSPESISKALEKTYGDVGDIAQGFQNVNMAKESGVSFLLKVDEVFADVSLKK